MLGPAIIAFIVFNVMNWLDGVTGTQAFTRPIILGTVTGLAFGDIKTGIELGAAMEATFIGISAIGGAIASDFMVATIIPITLVICAGFPEESAIAVSVTLGVLVAATNPFDKFIRAAMQPFYLRFEKARNWKAWKALFWLDGLILRTCHKKIIIFFGIWLGSDLLTTAVDMLPAWFMNGMNVASGMLVVIGMCLIASSIWDRYTPVFVIIGFILAKFLGLSTVVIALLGLCIVMIMFKLSKQTADVKAIASASGTKVITDDEEDDFYG